jgi:hypothetical protein
MDYAEDVEELILWFLLFDWWKINSRQKMRLLMIVHD